MMTVRTVIKQAATLERWLSMIERKTLRAEMCFTFAITLDDEPDG